MGGAIKVVVALALALVLLGTACGNDPAPVVTNPVALGEVFSIDVGESVDVAGPGLTVTYVALLSESRCPPDVVCITAGNAAIAVTVEVDGRDPATLTLNTTEGPMAGGYEGYTIELIELEFDPSPTARLRVSRS